MGGYFSEKRGLKNIYEKLCFKYSRIPSSFNIQSMNNSKESINSSKEFIHCMDQVSSFQDKYLDGGACKWKI